MTLADDLALAHELADAADAHTLVRFRAQDLQVAAKPDLTPVSDADTAVEAQVRRTLAARRPGDAVLGEEEGLVGDGPRQWVVDPVDGTKNFVHGSPDHAVMVSEVRDGVTERGWIWQPEHRTAWVAERGAGVRRNGEPVHRDPAGDQPQGATSIWSRRGRNPEGLPPLRGSWVCCGVDYPKLLEGEADYVLYGHTNPWDHLPGALMVSEAGGAVAHRDGTPYTARTTSPGLVVAADPATLALAITACEELWPKRSK